MNERILDGINSAAGQSALIDDLVRFAASDLLYMMLFALGLLTLCEFQRSRERASIVTVSVLLATAFTVISVLLVASLIWETRPFVTDGDTVLLLAHTADNSFPSEHAAGAAALAAIGAVAWSSWRTAFVLAGLAVGFARVAAGLHYPGDVLAGWTLGAMSAGAAWAISTVLARRFAARSQR